MTKIRWELIEFESDDDGKIIDAHLRIDQTHMPLGLETPAELIITDDLFHPAAPDGWIDLVVTIAAVCKRHSFSAPTLNPDRAAEYWRILETESEQQTAGRLAIAIHRGTLPMVEGFRWPLPNLEFLDMKGKIT